MKKKNGLTKCFAIYFLVYVAAMTILGVTAYADSGADYYRFYDLENISGANARPDTDWSYAATGSTVVKDEETESKVWSFNKWAQPKLTFQEKFTDGILKISYDLKIEGSYIAFDQRVYDGNNKYVIAMMGDNAQGGQYVSHPSKLSTSYSRTDSDISWDKSKWTRVDIVITMNNGGGVANTYLDGKSINSAPIDCSALTGITAIDFRASEPTGATAQGNVRIDNICVSRSMNEGLLLYNMSDEKVALEDGTVCFRLSERVDESLLVPSNVVVSHIVTGKRVNNFELTDVTAQKFCIKFNGAIPAGKYMVSLSPVITGELSGESLSTGITIRTEPKKVAIDMQFADENFDGYTAGGGEVPHGFVNLEGESRGIAVAAIGKSGEDGDVAMGFENIPRAKSATRFMYPFEAEIPEGGNFTVEFDVYRSATTSWYLYLPESGDFDVTNADYKKNAAISVNSTGTMMYALSRNEDTSSSTGITNISADSWHHISLTVIANKDTSKYVISADDSEPLEFTVNRDFGNCKTSGVGFGFVSSAADGYIRFDNLTVNATINVIQPEIESIRVYSYDGKEATGSVLTSMITSAEVEFNTLVDEYTAIQNTSIYQNGMLAECEKEIKNEDGVSVLVINFPKMLETSSEYKIEVSPGIASAYADISVSEDSDSRIFQTDEDAAVILFDKEMISDESTYRFKIAKNTNEKAYFTVALCTYETVERTVDEETQLLPKLSGIRYVPVALETDEKGITEYEIHEPFLTEDDKVQIYVWSYPSLHDASPDDSGKIAL